MTKPPAPSHNITSDNLQTWMLRVYIHCEGCRKKVYKVLQNIDGVYKTVIDAKEHKATVTGSVNGEFLVQKLLKAGKHAEILPESFSAPAGDNASGNSSSKKKNNNNKQNDVVPKADETEHVKDGNDAGKVHETADDQAVAGDGISHSNGNKNGGGGKKKKKNKGEKNDNVSSNGDTDGLPTSKPAAVTGDVGVSMEQLNLGHSMPQMVYSTPYDLPPYDHNDNYYPTPAAYGVSYSTSYPSAESSSYYTPPVYGYAQSHPSGYYPLPPPPQSYSRSAFDDHDDEGGEGRVCVIM